MPTVDLNDDQIALLDRLDKIGGAAGLDQALRALNLHTTLYRHKDTATSYQAAIKKAFPDAQVDSDRAAPYVEQVRSEFTPVVERMTKFMDDEEARRKKAEEDSLQGDFNTRWTNVVKEYELTDEGEEALGKFMKDRRLSINDPEAAAALYFKLNPKPAAPVTPNAIAPATWRDGMGLGTPADGDAAAKLLLSNPEAFADQEAANVLTEIRRAA